jgi:xanthine/uracil/vitamin C permease (AzgA family)
VCGIGCLIGGLFANLPFIVAPPTSVSIFYSVFVQQRNFNTNDASTAVIISGLLLVLFGYRPLGHFLSKVFHALYERIV